MRIIYLLLEAKDVIILTFYIVYRKKEAVNNNILLGTTVHGSRDRIISYCFLVIENNEQ